MNTKQIKLGIYAMALALVPLTSVADGNTPAGPPNRIGSPDTKSVNRTSIRKPFGVTKNNTKPAPVLLGGQNTDSESGDGAEKPKPTGPNLGDLLDLSKEVHAKVLKIIGHFKKEVAKIESDNSLNPVKKRNAKKAAHQKKIKALAEILTAAQMKKLVAHWRENARPSADGPGRGSNPIQDGEFTREQRRQLAAAFRALAKKLIAINNSTAEEDIKEEQRVAAIDNYKTRRSQILSAGQIGIWAGIDGIPHDTGEEEEVSSDGGDESEEGYPTEIDYGPESGDGEPIE